MNKIVHDILFTQPVATGYCIVKVVFKAVMILRDSGRPPFCSNSVAAHWVYF